MTERRKKELDMAIDRFSKTFTTDARTSVETRKPSIKMLGKNEIEGIIREHAYKLWEQRGYKHGHDLDDWLKAERMVTRV